MFMSCEERGGITVSLGNVLILVENLSVPLDRRVWQECESLRDAGYKIYVICPQGAKLDVKPVEVIDGVTIHRYPLRSALGGPAGYIREYALAFAHTYRLISRLAGDRDFAVVHACNPPDFLLLAALPLRRRGTSLVFDHHDLVPELYLSRFRRGRGLGFWMASLLERFTFSIADVVISTNDSYARVAVGRGGQHPNDVFVVRSAPDLEQFRRGPADSKLRHGKEHLLVYLGVMGPQDGVDHALRALAALRTEREDWHATFVGAGDVFAEMVELSRSLGLEDCVDFTGRIPRDELLAVLSTADVGLAPDPKNPLNDVSTMNKIVEYMALELPVVSYDLREARVSAGDAAVYAAPSDPHDFARSISQLLDAPEVRARMGRSGHARVTGDLSWEQSEKELLRAYERAIERRNGVRVQIAAHHHPERSLR
jgi:glycosyltransferase involved in cell wall biosynthesis